MRACPSPMTKASDRLRTSQLIGSSVTLPATRIGSPFKVVSFCCTSGTVRKYMLLPVAPENMRKAMDMTMTNTPTDSFTCCFDTTSILPRSLFEVSSEDNSYSDIHFPSHSLSYLPSYSSCSRQFCNIQQHIQNSLSSSS